MRRTVMELMLNHARRFIYITVHLETGDDAICLKSGKNAVARQIE